LNCFRECEVWSKILQELQYEFYTAEEASTDATPEPGDIPEISQKEPQEIEKKI
jgi:hypothetical protein